MKKIKYIRFCIIFFIVFFTLMIHRKSEHKNIVAMCRNNLVGKCSFSADLCWWSHKEGSEKDIECYFCDDKFESRALVMMHRRKEHSKTVKSCTQFLNSKCTFGEQSCWFSHEGSLKQRQITKLIKPKVRRGKQRV